MISPEVLRRYPYFAGVDEESLKAVAMIAEEKSVPAGTQMFSEGVPADTMNIIVRGEVSIQYVLGNGERRTVDTLIDGDKHRAPTRQAGKPAPRLNAGGDGLLLLCPEVHEDPARRWGSFRDWG